MKYFALIGKTKINPQGYELIWGSYEREECVEEKEEYKDEYKNIKIIRTGESQKSIDNEIDKLNKKDGFTKRSNIPNFS